MAADDPSPTFADLERQHGIPADTFCGLTPLAGCGQTAVANDEFDRAVADGLARHFPELTEDARRVIAGNYSYSHAK